MQASFKSLEKSAELDYMDREGNTALVLAIIARENAITEVLLNVGANVNLAGNKALTPLMLAVINNDAKLTNKLATKGVEPDSKNDDENTALTLAINNGAGKNVIDSLITLSIDVKLLRQISPHG
ncbi:ankyrin repeat domain-containing protein [Sodalis sp. dw_96]|uniref:ankyrin repeat domain-containing protein n=1 Tax=Sodalis sp. dw_96 TaxID=2719794 RepID=UPI001BD4F600|nr:ankyrin repeat domain-containing protein [Sodalis sp. dw_96]